MWSIAQRRSFRSGQAGRRGRGPSNRPDWRLTALEDRLLLTVTNETSHATFGTIQAAIGAASAGDTLQIDNTSGTYTEAVTVNKSLTLTGVGNPTVTAPSGSSQSVFHVTAPNVTIQGLDIVVNRPSAAAGIFADQSQGDNYTGLKVLNNTIESAGAGGTLTTGFGTTSAAGIALLNGGSAFPIVTIQGNTINNDGSANFFSRGIWLRQTEATIGGSAASAGNTITASGQDVLDQLASANGTDHNVVQNNNFDGAGLTLSSPNAGTVDVTSNHFTPNSTTYPQSLAIEHNALANALVNVTSNTFSGFGNVGIFSGASQGVTITSNTFTPAPGTTSAPTNDDAILVDTSYTPDAGGSPTALATNAITIQSNTFSPATNDAGRALDFQNNNPSGSGFGTITIGGSGTLANTFKAGLSQFIRLTPSQLAPDSATAVSPGPFTANLDASNNQFDVGSGPGTPGTMQLAQQFSLEDKIVHAVDDSALGFVTVVANTAYVTPNSFFPPATTAPNIQNAVNAVPSGSTVNVQAGTYTSPITITKTLSLLGAQRGTNATASTRGGSSESVLNVPTGAINIQADNVIVSGFTIQGQTSTSTQAAAIVTQATHSGYQILNDIIQNNVVGLLLASSGTTAVKVQNNLFQNDNQAGTSSGTGVLTGSALLSATISQNTFTGLASAGINVAGGVTGLTITSNTLVNNSSRGIYVTVPAAGTPNSGVTVNFNRFFGNAAAGLEIASGAYNGTLNATDNWWGSSKGPNVTGNDKALGGPNVATWLVLGVSAVNPTIAPSGSTTVVADLTKDNKGASTSSSGTIEDGTTVAFAATGGTVNPTTAQTAAGLTPSSGSGQVVFKPNTTGSATVTATLDNDSVNASITIQAGSISPTTLPNTDVNVLYNQMITASGGSGGFTYAVSSGALPAGLALSSASGTETITGTPTTAGTSTFTITATDSNGAKTSQSYTVTINPTLTFHPPSLTAGSVGNAYTFQFTATGGTAPLTFSVVSGILPPGLTLSSSGRVSGTPTQPGTYPFTVQVADSAPGSVTSTNVNPPGTWVPFPVSITITGNQVIQGGPTVTNLQRFGKASNSSILVLTFSTTLNAFTAQNVGNYQLTQVTGNRTGRRVPIRAAIYDPTNNTVTLYPSARFAISGHYKLVVDGTHVYGITDVNGAFLDGLNNGKSGSNYVKTFGREIFAGPNNGKQGNNQAASLGGHHSAARHAAIDAALRHLGGRKRNGH